MTTAEKNYTEYKSWQEVDFALKYLAEKKIKLKQLEVKRDEEINELLKKNYFEIGILEAGIAQAEEGIKKFAEAHKDDLADSKTKKFPFGKVSIKTSKSLVLDCVDYAVSMLEKIKRHDLIKVKKEVPLAALKTLDDETLQLIGASVVSKDNISVETTV